MIDGTPSNPSWVSQFQTLSKGLVTTNYNPSGSASGEASILSRSVDFGISSCPLNDAERLSLNASIIHFPIFLGALEIAYNIPAQFISGPLNLTADILSGIYQAKITRWNDPLILASNPKLNYTAVINPISRSEGAGVTQVFTNYLSVAAADWALGVSKSIKWPSTVTSVMGDSTVVQTVSTVAGALGYANFGLAAKYGMQSAAIRNADGIFVTASLQTIEAAATPYETAGAYPAGTASWAAISLVNQPGATSWPMAHFEYAMFFQDQRSTGEKGAALAAFMNFITTNQAQRSTTSFRFIALGNAIRATNIASLDSILLADDYSLISYWNPYPVKTPPPDADLRTGTIASLVVIGLGALALVVGIAVFAFLEWRSNDVEFL